MHVYFVKKKFFISTLRLFVRKGTANTHLEPICRGNVITVTTRAHARVSCAFRSHPTQLRDIRDKLLALPISYLHFITGIRVICTLGRRIGDFLPSRHVAVEKARRVVAEQVQVPKRLERASEKEEKGERE